jgi:hypothetical protein
MGCMEVGGSPAPPAPTLVRFEESMSDDGSATGDGLNPRSFRVLLADPKARANPLAITPHLTCFPR